MRNVHFMADFETIGIGAFPAIAQLSVVAFCPKTFEILNQFDKHIDLQSCVDAGLEITPSTIQWWLSDKHSQEVRDSVFARPTAPLAQVLEDLRGFIQVTVATRNMSSGDGEVTPYLWGNGVRADNQWLDSAYLAVGAKNPFQYWQDVCFRTLRTLAKANNIDTKLEFKGMQHNGLDDAKHQVRVLQHITTELGVSIDV